VAHFVTVEEEILKQKVQVCGLGLDRLEEVGGEPDLEHRWVDCLLVL